MFLNPYNTAYKAAAYYTIGYTFVASSIVITGLAFTKINGFNPQNKPFNNWQTHLKISSCIGVSSALAISYLAAKVLLKD